ncbi:winged helix-turn-helix transcriptional regulator [Paenarthrobacter sp. CM16]|uniref:ArsR/SmtB family transcription factor n=1 Tax=Paenarthrobacter sp. CM16 TaxID=2738447 RepID=UPI001553C4BD|nr:metalloregulator ArsR/SmtB family transcription factor [Paenarthrobacter sp. CM16]NQD88436.1 winged helix-turn-helix transcriptional regulator [Paenarthrobacter sp. CM16]
MEQDALDRAFMALADPVRRAMVARLSRGDATVNELAEPFAITKQAVSKHIQVLEHAGLVTRSRDAQRRPVHLDAAALERLTAWIDQYRLLAESRFRQLDELLGASQNAAASHPEQENPEQENTAKKKEELR